MERLRRILCRPVKDTPRTREYQTYIDAAVERTLATFDLDRGLLATKGIAELPVEADPDYINLPLEERVRRLDDEAAKALANSSSRETTAVYAVLAWCYRMSFSKYYRDASVVEVVKNGLESFIRRQREDGVWVFGRSEDGGFGMGWTVEGMIMAVVWLREELGEDLVTRCMEMFRKAVGSFKNDAGFHPVSNQQSVWCFNMQLFGLLLDEQEYIDAARAQWDICRFVFGRDGQVIEQGGPCANYSRTTFIYAFLYLVLTEDRGMDAQIVEALKWFRRMHTNSMYPFEGMSSRSSHFTTHHQVDLLGALERFAPREPILGHFINEYVAQEKRDMGKVTAIGHGASPLLWAMLEHQGEVKPTEADIARWKSEPFDRMYWTWDIQYMLVNRRYQTAVTFRGRSALMGLQTWAWGDEPPILHPTTDAPSTTLAMGIDTASFGVSHNRVGRGAGLKAEEVTYIPGKWSELKLQYEPVGIDHGMRMPALDRYFRWTQSHHNPGGFRKVMKEGDPVIVVTRWAKLWCMYIFTPGTALVMQGGVGPRTTRWAFNPICVPEPILLDDGVAFDGRDGRLFALGASGRLDDIEGVPVVAYAFNVDQPAVFAFSNSEFAFEEHDIDARTLTFRDAEGRYRANYANVTDHLGHVQWDDGAYVNTL